MIKKVLSAPLLVSAVTEMSPSERYKAKAIPFFNLPIILETFLWPRLTLQVHDSSLTFIGELAAAIFCKNN